MDETNDDSPSWPEEKGSLGNDTPRENNVCRPVSPFDSGEGLPYAPEGWPEPDDIWGWKVGGRINSSGYYQDRYLYPPKSLQKPSYPKKFQSMAEVRRYIKTNFPDYLGEFFASFCWKVPSKKPILTKVQSLSTLTVKTLETTNEGTEKTPVRRKRERNAKSLKQPAQKSFRAESLPIEQDANPIFELCSINQQASPPIESTKDLCLKGNSGSESDQFLSCDYVSLENDIVSSCYLASSKKGSDIQTVPEKSPNGNLVENFDDYLNSLEDILDLPCTETSLTDPVKSNTAVENEKTNCRKKLSTLLAMDFPSLVTSNSVAELSKLTSQLCKDPSLTEDQVIKLKLVEEIPLVSKDFLEAKENIEQANKFFADLEAKNVEVTCLKKSDSELKDKVAGIQVDMDSSAIAIQEIDNHISQLQSKRSRMLCDLESKKKIKAELISSQTSLTNSILTVDHDIQLRLSEKAKWETKKVNSVQREAEILDKFVSLRGFTF